MAFRVGWTDTPDYHRCDSGIETAVHAFFHCPQVHPFWDHVGELTVRIDPEHLMSIDLAYVCDSVSASWSRVKPMIISNAASRGIDGSVDDAVGVSLTSRTLFSSVSDWILCVSAQDEDQI